MDYCQKSNLFAEEAQEAMREQLLQQRIRAQNERNRKLFGNDFYSSPDRFKVVASMDIGTGTLGCKLGLISDEDTTFEIQLYDDQILGAKIPNHILIRRSDKKVAYIGEQAKDRVVNPDLFEDGDCLDNYLYFKSYKMHLYKPCANPRVKAENCGVYWEVHKVFAAVIAYVKERVMKFLMKQHETGNPVWEDFREYEIKWVLTIPAIWERGAVDKMVKAAFCAGIDVMNLMFVSEPEGAIVKCSQFNIMPGNRVVVVDCGAGTIDIAVMQMNRDGTLKTIEMPNGNPNGGDSINTRILGILNDLIFGEGVQPIKDLKYSKLENEIEDGKKSELEDEYLYFNLDKAYDIDAIEGRLDAINGKYHLDPPMTISKGRRKKIGFPCSFIKQLMRDCAFSIEEILREICDRCPSIDFWYVAGSYSESKVLRAELNEVLGRLAPGKVWIQPPNCSLAIAEGAVELGINPTKIASRTSPVWIAVESKAMWSSERFAGFEQHRTPDGRSIQGALSTIVRKGSEVEGTKKFSKKYRTQRGQEIPIKFYCYTQSQELVHISQDGWNRLGQDIVISAENNPGGILDVTVHCGGVMYIYRITRGSEVIEEGILLDSDFNEAIDDDDDDDDIGYARPRIDDSSDDDDDDGELSFPDGPNLLILNDDDGGKISSPDGTNFDDNVAFHRSTSPNLLILNDE